VVTDTEVFATVSGYAALTNKFTTENPVDIFILMLGLGEDAASEDGAAVLRNVPRRR
jgi:hypothetical protein